jgi:hypothetical protein
MLYQRDHAAPPTATCFPIVQVMRDTLEPGDTVRLLAIRQENADTARNYQRLLEELAQLLPIPIQRPSRQKSPQCQFTRVF